MMQMNSSRLRCFWQPSLRRAEKITKDINCVELKCAVLRENGCAPAAVCPGSWSRRQARRVSFASVLAEVSGEQR